MKKTYVEVLLIDFNLNPLIYSLPEQISINIGIGTLVSVPLKNRSALGFVINIFNHAPDNLEVQKILEIHELVSTKRYFDEKYLQFYNFTATYYCTDLSLVIKSSFPKASLIKKTDRITVKVKNPLDPVIEFISKTKKCTFEKILRAFPSLEYKHLLELKMQGFIEIDTDFMYKKIFPPDEYFINDSIKKDLTLNEEQKQFFKEVINSEDKPFIYLLTGKTGTGKTEALIKLSEKFLKNDRSVLYLVPEIALAAYIYKKITEFIEKEKVFIWHSSLSQKIRRFTFDKILDTPSIVIGTRSSIFLPLKNPGLIIVDEEHDTSYKQESKFSYNARDLSIARGKIFSHPVVLSSATPSLESLYKSKEGNYKFFVFGKRYHPRNPEIIIVDPDKDKLINGFFSQTLINNIKENLDKNEQSLIFINRRGYVPYVYCNECKNFILCKFCTVPLTWHKKKNIFACHKCGFTMPFQNFCKECKSVNISFFGAGTEKIAEILSNIFPFANIIKIDRESTEKPEYFKKELSSIIEGKYDIIVATQILTKGHHFPKLTLVGVLLGDQGLNLPDFRAQERTFQLLTQVFGRTGRELPGRVIIQTSLPDAPAIKFAMEEDVEGFYDYEIELRKQTDFPPIKRLLIIKVFSKEEQHAKDSAKILYEKSKKFEKADLQIFEPLEAPIFKEKGYYKFHIYCKSNKPHKLIKLVRALKNIRLPKNVRVYFDLDPLNLL